MRDTTRSATAGIITIPKPAFTTSRADITIQSGEDSSMRMGISARERGCLATICLRIVTINPVMIVDPEGCCPYHWEYHEDCDICYQERVNEHLAGINPQDESELFAFDPPDPSTIVRPPKQDDRPTYSDIQTLVTYPLNISTTLLGTGAQTVSEAAALGAIGFARNVPISVMFRWNNPGLTTNQKWVMTGYDVGVGLVGIVKICGVEKCPKSVRR